MDKRFVLWIETRGSGNCNNCFDKNYFANSEGKWLYAVAAVSFLLIWLLKVSFVVIVVLALAAGVIRYFQKKDSGRISAEEKATGDAEEDFIINKNTKIPGSGISLKRILLQTGAFILLWAAPLLVFWLCFPDFVFWKRLMMFFTSAAFITFGEAYAVLPYVAQISVEKFQWLTHAQMINGLVLGETTPGPLIMVLAFVGFIAAWQQFGASLLFATVALLATTWYTFLPGFYFIFAGAPVIEKTQQDERVKEILAVISAAVVGVLLSFCITIMQAVLFSSKEISFQNIDWFILSWIVVSFFAMHRFKINMIAWIGVSALAGLAFKTFIV